MDIPNEALPSNFAVSAVREPAEVSRVEADAEQKKSLATAALPFLAYSAKDSHNPYRFAAIDELARRADQAEQKYRRLHWKSIMHRRQLTQLGRKLMEARLRAESQYVIKYGLQSQIERLKALIPWWRR